MKFGKADKSETWAEDKIKFTAIKQLGDEKFFQAARDYMYERNSGKFIHDWGHPVANPSVTIRMCCMLEETAFMQTIEAFHKPTQWKGIVDVLNSHDYLDVLINGNLVFFSDPADNDPVRQFLGLTKNKMTDLCNGRFVEVGANSPASRDETPVISGLNPTLAGPDARYVLQSTAGAFTFAQGRVPLGADEQHAIGGLHTDYNSGDATSWPIQMMGYGKTMEAGKGVVFTATGRSLADKGKGPEFKAAAEQSGVPPSPGGRIQLFFCDFGETSPALAHSNPAGDLKLIWKGKKHDGDRYFVNTYVGFIARRPR
jgi:hypothetical protein